MTILHQTNSVPRSARSALMVTLGVFACSLLQASRVQAQNDLSVTASFNSQTPLTPDTPIELHLSRSLKTEEGRIAVLIDHADLTTLFIIDGVRLVYSPALVPLPLGESQLILYLITNDNKWREVARFPLQVVKEKPAPMPTALPEPKSGTTPVNISGSAQAN